MKKIFLFIIILVVVVGFWVSNRGSDQSAETEAKDESGSSMEGDAVDKLVVTYTADGYSPSSLEIKKGDTVVFTNESSSPNWPASAVHPTHKAYPGSSITKCGSDEADAMFDACEDAASGESWSFTFNEVGEWSFHNHRRFTHTGVVTVTE